MDAKVVTVLILSFASMTFGDDFKTVNGKEYKEATVTRVDPDGIVLKTKSGVTKIYFTELPKDIQEQFHYEPAKAAWYSAEQAANYETYQKQQEETRRQQADADVKNKALSAEQQAATNRTQALQTRYAELQKEEDHLLLQIGDAKRPGPEYREGKSLRHRPNPLASQLPLLQSHLSDVRSEKKHVQRQLEKTKP